MFTICYPRVGAHRFAFIINEIRAKGGKDNLTNRHDIEKCLILDNNNWRIFIDAHDGLTGIQETSLEIVTQIVKKMHPAKKNFYVISNFSTNGHLNVVQFATKFGLTIIQCHPWSLYFEAVMIANSMSKTSSHDGKLLFVGTITPQRKFMLSSLKDYYNDRFDCISGLKTYDCMSVVRNSMYCVQLDGIGPRHQTYEAMAVGIPSLIQENSYLHATVRNSNIVLNFEQSPSINELEDIRTEYAEKAYKAYKEKMTSSAIVSEIFDKVGDLVEIY